MGDVLSSGFRFCFLAFISSASLPLVSYGQGVLHDEREVYLTEVRQLTFGGENAEAYWSPDGTELVFQSTREPYECDQIFRMPITDPSALSLVSTGQGRTTCGYFTSDSERIIFSSTHADNAQCPIPPDRSQGYVWPLYDSFQIYSSKPDGSDLMPLTDTNAYDAEATVCSVDGSIVFTSTRDGDLELYRMEADGSDVRRLTESSGYDGGAFFSRDCSRIVWRASRPTGDALTDYQLLLEEGLVRPSDMELWVANADGSEARQITYLGGANFAPFFFPNGERVLFSSNHHDPSRREFDIWAIDIDGTSLEQVTFTPDFDGFPMFSPDGESLVFVSNRNQGAPGETDIYLANWNDSETRLAERPVDRYIADVAWLADDDRTGRGIRTSGLAASADWLEEQFKQIGLEPAGGDGSYRQSFDAVYEVQRGINSSLVIDGESVPSDNFVIPGFSANSTLSAPVIFAGWGIKSDEHEIDDYEGLDVEGHIVLVRRYTPDGGVFEDSSLQRRFGDLRYKAFMAREHGAIGLLVADLPLNSDEEEPALPNLRIDSQGSAGIPVAVITRDWAESLINSDQSVNFTAELIVSTRQIDNIVGRLSASDRIPGAVLIGAHYDHLGFGGSGSLTPEVSVPHNGADDNASGTAALLEAARVLSNRTDTLRRDVVFVAFTGEEAGLLGSSYLTQNPPAGTAPAGLVAMLNMDMVGRLRNNRVAVLGSDSAEEWDEVVQPVCDKLRIECQLGGDGYGPSDQTPFYAAGVPVLHFFTGTHAEYHKPSDDIGLINAAGGVKIANLAAEVAANLSGIDTLTYRASEAPAPMGDMRGYGASLGSIPDYAGSSETRPGMLLSGVRAGGPAEDAGLQRGDLITELAGREVRDIYDLMFILQEVKPGEQGNIVYEREGEMIETIVIFGGSSGR
ncbi:M20/M25/M40 family metallo-hydrolase [Gammaproteobacteria bacterium]|nr:M20/M25/M40 family metallo-hydrolase [Gammaproteobacteria bacterium]